MKYTWPKFRLCRREQVNLFWPAKYQLKKRRTLPGQHHDKMVRYSEYWKLLRNKQVLKRSYLLTEKQFSKIVKVTAAKYSKNKNIRHDFALFQLLESRLDAMVLRSWFADTIMQARQMVTHWNFLLNWSKHNIPSSYLEEWDVITVKQKLQTSPLFSHVWTNNSIKLPSWIKVDKNKFSIEVLSLPKMWEVTTTADILKVIEFYARV